MKRSITPMPDTEKTLPENPIPDVDSTTFVEVGDLADTMPPSPLGAQLTDRDRVDQFFRKTEELKTARANLGDMLLDFGSELAGIKVSFLALERREAAQNVRLDAIEHRLASIEKRLPPEAA
jgi:hypothetical protein